MNVVSAVKLLAEFGPGTCKAIALKAGAHKVGNLSTLLIRGANRKEPMVKVTKTKDGNTYAITKAGRKWLAETGETIYTVKQINDGEVPGTRSQAKKSPMLRMSKTGHSAVDSIVVLIDENRELKSVISRVIMTLQQALQEEEQQQQQQQQEKE